MTDAAATARRPDDQRVVRVYLALSASDYFADMVLVVTSVLLLQSRLGAKGVFLTIAAVWVVEGVSEVPTGVVADAVGRRSALAVSFVLRAVGYSALFFSDSPVLAVAGTLLAAHGGTWGSGALEAWAVDALQDRSPGVLDRLFLRGRIFENVGLVGGTMCGAAVGLSSLALPQVLAAGACVAGVVPCLLLMKEPGRLRPPEPSAGALLGRAARSSREVVSGAARSLRADAVLVGLLVGTAAMWMFRGVPGVQWSVHFSDVTGGGLLVLGLMRSASALAEIPLLAAVSGLQARGRDVRRAVMAGAGGAGGALLLCAALLDSRLGILAYVCFSVAFGLCLPGARAALNERIEDAHRATVLSFASTCNSLLTAAGLLLVSGTVGGLGDVRVAWSVAAAGFAVAAVTVAVVASRVRPLSSAGAAPGAPALAAEELLVPPVAGR